MILRSRKQLIAAIGKEVGPVDFANYQRFHNRKLFRKEYQPRPFSYAIRRPGMLHTSPQEHTRSTTKCKTYTVVRWT